MSQTAVGPESEIPIVGLNQLALSVESSDASTYFVDRNPCVGEQNCDKGITGLARGVLTPNVAQEPSVNLTAGDGVKRFNACFADEQRNCACTELAVRLDTQAPSFTVKLYDVHGREIVADNADGLRRIVDPNITVRVELNDINGDGVADDPTAHSSMGDDAVSIRGCPMIPTLPAPDGSMHSQALI